VHREVGEQGGLGEQGADGPTALARPSSGAAGAAPAIDGVTNGKGAGRGER
jgi:hypothetical protein